MSELPSGTVTFLFTDIEGSTRLLRELGRDGYDEVLAAHHELLTAAFAAHDGRIVDTQGDSFFVAFRTAADAVAAAVDAQRELAARPWPGGAVVRVRMGLHTGEPKVGADRYVGVVVHKAARIGAAGHGAQVLLSSTTKELAEEELPAGVSIRDLGQRRLKDLERPERLFQLVIEGLVSEFAQLKTLDVELRRRRRRLYAGSALIGVVAAAVAVPVFALGQGTGGGEMVSGNAVAVIDPASGRVVDQATVGSRPQAIAYGAGGVWVANLGDETISRVDPSTGEATRTISLGGPASDVAADRRDVWAVSVDPAKSEAVLTRIDPRFDVVSKSVRLSAGIGATTGTVALGGGGLWFGTDAALLERVDAAGKVTATVDTGNGPGSAADGLGAVWLADPVANNVVRVDDATRLVAPAIPVGNGPSEIATGAGSIWVADQGDDAVVRVDPVSNAVTQSIEVGRSPTGLSFGYGAVWVANSRDGTVSRIDPSTNQVTRTIPVGGSPQRVAVGGGRVWVSVEQPLSVSAAGGVVRVDAPPQVIGSLDPALGFDPWSWSILYVTCAKLLNYPDRPAPAGSRLEPEVAAALPKSLDGGRTYRFTVRKGFRFSPPSNEPVTAETFRYAIERTLSPRIDSPARSYAADIVGAAAYAAGKAKHISGVSVTGNTLTIRLRQPAPDFLARIALPFFCAVPRDTPVNSKGVSFLPGAGPYYVASYTPEQGAVLKANPNYRGSRPQSPQEIDYRVGLSPDQEIHEVEAGEADFAAGGVPQQAIARLARAYGPGSAAARAGHQQYFVNPTLSTTYVALNTSRPLFADAKLREALNFALDRKTLARIAGFGYAIATPTDQLLPPGMPGFRPAHIYPLTPNLARARGLARGRGGHAVLYSCSYSPCREAAQVIQADLKPIGIDVEIKSFPLGVMFGRAGTRGAPFDMVFDAWVADYPDPADFFNLVYGPLIAPTNNINYSYFDSPAWNRRIAASARLSGARRYLAYAALDADLGREGPPYAAIWNGSEQDFFSARAGCQLAQPIYGIDLATLCIRKGTGGR